jgi:hypothetical protein
MRTSFKDFAARRELAQATGVAGAHGGAFNEMAARRSFKRSMGKFEPQAIDKAVAIITAWRGELLDPAGQPYLEAVRRRLNDKANRNLIANIQRRGLSYYPVVGAGQEANDQGVFSVNKENSLVVQPIGNLNEMDFIESIQQLLFNPTGEVGPGPFPHTQWGVTIKLPSNPQAFLLYHSGNAPTGPQDYTQVKPLGDTAESRLPHDWYYTQMKYGPRAEPAMMDPLDQPGDVGNPCPGTGKPGARLPGNRFTIKNRSQP